MSIAVKISGTKEVMAALEKIGDAFNDKLRAAVMLGCLIVQNDAKEKCAYITGNLRSSIHTEVAKEKDAVSYYIFSNRQGCCSMLHCPRA